MKPTVQSDSTDTAAPPEATHPTPQSMRDVALDLRGVRRFSKRFVGTLPPDALLELTSEVPLERDVELALTVTVKGEEGRLLARLPPSVAVPEKRFVRVDGWVRCAVQQACARCLSRFVTTLQVAVDRLFLPEPEPDPEPSGGQREMVDDLTYLADGRLELDRLVEEELLLALPMMPVCRSTCAGLCAGCGLDLNKTTCRCEAKKTDGPFAVLANFSVR